MAKKIITKGDTPLEELRMIIANCIKDKAADISLSVWKDYNGETSEEGYGYAAKTERDVQKMRELLKVMDELIDLGELHLY